MCQIENEGKGQEKGQVKWKCFIMTKRRSDR